MTKKKKALIAAGVFLGVAFIVGITVIATGVYGTQSDPLVTKSYVDSVKTSIDNTLSESVSDAGDDAQSQFDTKIQSYSDNMQEKIDGANANAADIFDTVNLTAGQTVSCGAGAELILRNGSVSSSGTSPAISDTTDGTAIDSANQALSQNHMYLIGANSTPVTAVSDSVVLVRGTYTVS